MRGSTPQTVGTGRWALAGSTDESPRHRRRVMTPQPRPLAAALAVVIAMVAADTALAQKSGGILRVPFFDSPARVSLHEESTLAALLTMLGEVHNLVMYKQDVRENS